MAPPPRNQATANINTMINQTKKTMKKRSFFAVALLALLSTFNSQLSTVLAQGTTFTYQGLLETNGIPVTGEYEFNFSLFDADAGGNRVAPIFPNNVAV